MRIKASDGNVHVLPGDCMYPENVNLTAASTDVDMTNMSLLELRDSSPVKNRMEYYSLDVKTLIVNNLDAKNGYITPGPLESVQVETKNV